MYLNLFCGVPLVNIIQSVKGDGGKQRGPCSRDMAISSGVKGCFDDPQCLSELTLH